MWGSLSGVDTCGAPGGVRVVGPTVGVAPPVMNIPYLSLYRLNPVSGVIYPGLDFLGGKVAGCPRATIATGTVTTAVGRIGSVVLGPLCL